MNKPEVCVTQLHAKFPKFDHMPGHPPTWKNLIVDAGDLLERFIGADFKCVARIEISGFFRLRRVFLFREGRVDYDNAGLVSIDLKSKALADI